MKWLVIAVRKTRDVSSFSPAHCQNFVVALRSQLCAFLMAMIKHFTIQKTKIVTIEINYHFNFKRFNRLTIKPCECPIVQIFNQPSTRATKQKKEKTFCQRNRYNQLKVQRNQKLHPSPYFIIKLSRFRVSPSQFPPHKLEGTAWERLTQKHLRGGYLRDSLIVIY